MNGGRASDENEQKKNVAVAFLLSNITITCGVGCLGMVGVVYTPSGGASASCFFLQLWFGDDLSIIGV